MTMPSDPLSPEDAAILETFVAPRYLSLYGDLMLEMLLAGEAARIVHVGSRTGYLDRELCRRFQQAALVGIDSSVPALELARAKVAMRGDYFAEYIEVAELPSPLEARTFTHAVSLCPLGGAEHRAALLDELSGLLCEGGQALVAVPLRPSFQEVGDLWREYALKHDDSEFGQRVEAAMASRPNLETLSEELEERGFDDVDVAVRPATLTFESGRAFVEDPVTRLMVLPDLRRRLGDTPLERPLEYLRDAIDRYWSEARFELTLAIGCASARRVD